MDRQPDPSLMQPCERPQVPPVNPSDTDIALAWQDAVDKFLACERRHADLITFVKGAT